MRVLRIAVDSGRSLSTNKLRTSFMMAGTIIGIAALVVIMAIGQGTQRKVMKRVRNFGPRAMMLIAGGGKDLPPPDMNVTTLTLEDAQAVRENVDGVELVSPMAWRFRMNLKRDANQIQSTVWGVEPNWHEAWNWDVTHGEAISAEDVAVMARTCVIGETVKRELFGDADAIGENLYVNKISLTVKGVLEGRGTSPMGRDFDNRIIVPITTTMRRVMNVDYVGAVRIITEDPSLIPKQAEAIRALIHERHHITPPEEDDFRIITPIVIAELARGTSRTLTMLLIALAALSLLVGGVVMMNILLISVVERTNEIGVRRAVGATRRDIFTQFLIESLAVTIMGMVLGSGLGFGICNLLAHTTEIPVFITWLPFAVAVGFALLVGTVFGVQPARRAARLHPTDALR